MPTFDLIQSQTISGANSVTFSGIPSTYTDLELHCFMNFSASSQINMRINGGSESQYRLIRTGSVGTSAHTFNTTQWQVPSSASSGTIFLRMTLDNYSNTTAEKSGFYYLNRDASTIEYGAIMKVNTEAISAVNFITTAGTFASGSTFHLYGIASS